ncbi:hypothetical protein MSPP1_002970 [Malassezia sp. CBS 17886]|nr:hypothetical protein MSPP1_002970 [Malassezia sp. CBS 17886]
MGDLGLQAPPAGEGVGNADEKVRLFVSWYTVRPPGEQRGAAPRLRGCIGTFALQDVRAGLAHYARQAAFHDYRFAPITAQEIPQLECSVSFLSPFEQCKDHLDWDIGMHGIYIYLRDPRSPHRVVNGNANGTSDRRDTVGLLTATFLPDIAKTQGWSKEETVDKAIQKAGWSGAVTPSMRASLSVFRYCSHKATLSYDDFTALGGPIDAAENGTGARA